MKKTAFSPEFKFSFRVARGLNVFVLLLLFAVFVCIAPAAYAATFTVTNLADSGPGSLRQAILDANSAAGADIINFSISGNITLVSSLPNITDATGLTINGTGHTVTIDGNNSVRAMSVDAGASLTLANLTIANGTTPGLGGGIQNTGTLTVSHSTFSGNSAGNGGGIANVAGGALSVDTSTFQNNATTGVGGGGIMTFGSTTVTNSTFVGNIALINGGAINVQPGGTLTLINSTLFGNSSGDMGGALSNLGTTQVFDSTFAANHGSSGAAIATGNSNVTIDNSAFTDNVAANPPGAIAPSATVTGSNNVFFNNTANGIVDDQTGYGTSNFISATAEPLAALGNYGGPTQTMLPLVGQAAICAGSIALLPSGLTTDQRGFPRTTVYGSTTCVDAGADQAQNQNITAVPTLSMPMLGLLGGLLAVLGIRRLRYVTR